MLYITTGRSTSSRYVMSCRPFRSQYQQTCYKQRGRLGKTPKSLFQHSSLTITGSAANNSTVKIRDAASYSSRHVIYHASRPSGSSISRPYTVDSRAISPFIVGPHALASLVPWKRHKHWPQPTATRTLSSVSVNRQGLADLKLGDSGD